MKKNKMIKLKFQALKPNFIEFFKFYKLKRIARRKKSKRRK